jgi:hypothetical protein
MALDTAAKRRSAGGVPFLPLGPGVTPDALAGQAWRQSAGWSYGGILAGAAVVLPNILHARSLMLTPRRESLSLIRVRRAILTTVERITLGIDGD